MKGILLSAFVLLSLFGKAQVFNYGCEHTVYRNVIKNGITYIKTGNEVFDSTFIAEMEKKWTISEFTYVERYKKPLKESTAIFITQKTPTKKYMYDRNNQNIVVIQPAAAYHKDKDVPMEQTLGYMYLNGFHPLASEEEEYQFLPYIIHILHEGLSMIKEKQYANNLVDLNNRIIETINEDNKSYNGNVLILNREMTRHYISEDLLKKYDLDYRIHSKEEFYKALKTKEMNHYLLYMSVNTKTEISLINIITGRWIYTKQFEEGYVTLKAKEIKLLKHYF